MLRPWSQSRHGVLHRRVFAAILAALLPLVLLSWLTLSSNAEHQKAEQIAAAQRAMQALITAVDSELQVSQAALEVLAASPRLQSGDLAGFHAEAVQAMRSRPNWANVVLSSPGAHQLVNARLPFGSTLPNRAAPGMVEQVARTGVPAVGDLAYSPVLKGPVVAMLVPVHATGPRAPNVLVAPIWPASVLALLSRQPLPERSLVSIVDRGGHIVARSRNNDTWTGRKVSPTLQGLLEEGTSEGWAVTTTLEGEPVYTIYRRSSFSGWTAALGIPVDVLDAPVRRSYRLLALSIGLAALLGVAAALMVTRSITGPMLELRAAADAAGRGETPALPDTDIPEIRRVAEAIVGAHHERERLLASEREAHQLEREARQVAEQANHAKDEFLAMLGHELRNPLAPIYTAAQLLKRHGANGANVQHLSAIVERQAAHLTRLVDDILDVSRVVRKRVLLRREPVDLNELLPQAVEQVQDQLAAHGHRLTLEPAGGPAWVLADRTRIVQVLVNLLGNAAKYTPDGGSVALRVVLKDEVVQAIVSDNGSGIAPALLPRVFDLFTQGARTLERAEGGLGLGLPLVRGLAELHGGSVEVQSAGTGQGSSFTVELPRIAAPAQAPGTGGARVAAVARARLMVVDDNLDAADMLAMYLEEQGGYQVQVFADPFAALEAAAANCPRALLLDIGMPRMDGYELARRLKADPRTAHAVLFAVSGYGQEKDRDAAAAAGFAAHFAKPVELDQLLAALAESLTV
jgi:signal transduction histidine kinase/ActR/RegA family two-component response regulator